MAKKRANRTTKVQYTKGKPTRNSRGSVSFTSSASDIDQVHSLSNPFTASARGSKLPDSDSSKSVPITIIHRNNISTDANGKFGIWVRPTLAEVTTTATTVSGYTFTTMGTPVAVADNTAIAAQFSKYRIVSWGVKVYSTLAPTNQSGYFTMITDPTLAAGMSANSAFYEEVLTYPTTETTVQWISKPVGNSYLDYIDIASAHSWDELAIYGDLLPASGAVLQIEVFFNLECQVKISAISAAIATPAADHKPHILTALGDVAKKAAGSKLADDVKRGFLTWIKGALGRGAQMGSMYLSKALGIPTNTFPMLTN